MAESAGKLPALQALIEVGERLPTLPAVAVEILDLTRDPDVVVEELAYALGKDSVLAAKLLRLANSSLFRRGEPVTTLVDAAVRLGLQTVKLMTLSFTLADVIPRSATARFDYTAYWRRSLVTTVAARSLARLSKSAYEDEAFVCGLLSHIGELVLAETAPARWADATSRNGGRPPGPALQRELLGLDHMEAAALLLQSWDLPEVIWRSVRHHGAPDDVPGDAPEAVRELARILDMATEVASFIGGPGDGRQLAKVQALGRRYFGVSSAETDAFVVALEGGIVETAMLLNTRLPAVESYDFLLERARRQLLAVSLDTVADLQASTLRAQELERRNSELLDSIQRDPLTSLPNRGGFDQFLREAIDARVARRDASSLGLLMLDVDEFKRLNDRHGHPVGDEVLRAVARSIRAGLRADSLAARYGGDEFGVVVPGVDLAGLESVAERIRIRIGEKPVEVDGERIAVSVTVGGALLRTVRTQRAARTLLARADDCLYQAKRAGRNCSVCREIPPV